jgi:hypothetical protein
MAQLQHRPTNGTYYEVKVRRNTQTEFWVHSIHTDLESATEIANIIKTTWAAQYSYILKKYTVVSETIDLFYSHLEVDNDNG